MPIPPDILSLVNIPGLSTTPGILPLESNDYAVYPHKYTVEPDEFQKRLKSYQDLIADRESESQSVYQELLNKLRTNFEESLALPESRTIKQISDIETEYQLRVQKIENEFVEKEKEKTKLEKQFRAKMKLLYSASKNPNETDVENLENQKTEIEIELPEHPEEIEKEFQEEVGYRSKEVIDVYDRMLKKLVKDNKDLTEFDREMQKIAKEYDEISNLIKQTEKIVQENDGNNVENSMREYLDKFISKQELTDKILKYQELYQRCQFNKMILDMMNQKQQANQNTCKICYTNSIDHAIIPCGHTFCQTCISQAVLSTCPVCRGSIDKKQKIFF